MWNFAGTLLDLIFPPRCPFCRKILKEYEHAICRSCEKSLPWTERGAQAQHFRPLDICVSSLYYEDAVRESLLRFKFSGLYSYAAHYAPLLKRTLDEQALVFDLITWVPVSTRRRKKRGYDQAELLSKELSRLYGKACKPLLLKSADNAAQSSIHSPAERRKNVSGVYRPLSLDETRGRQVLLVDDIVTTGSTLCECARVLKIAGAKSVSAVTVARSRKD